MHPFHRLIVFVSNVEASAAFYQKAFDFVPLPSASPSSEWLELETGGATIAFHKAKGEGSGSGDVKLVFYAEDVPGAVADLKSRGIAMGKIQTFEDLVFCDGKDPNGHRFQVSNRK
jgi:hypothetical protein